ncbi:MAG: ATP-binding protein [Cryobacterium sp.]
MAAPEARNRAPWTLRRRLVMAVVGLLTLVSIAIGLVSVAILRASLMDGLDGQLASAAARSASLLRGDRDDDGDGHGRPSSAQFILSGPAQPPGTVAFVYDGTTPTAMYIDEESGELANLSATQVNLLARQIKQPRPINIDLGGKLGDYRVVSEKGRGGVQYIIGLPMEPVNGTVAQLATIVAVVSLVGVAVAALIAALIVRLALRPLRRVTATAARVSELQLDRGAVDLVDRVPAADADQRTEVGRVGSALNRMLDHVDLALETRHASEKKIAQFVADASHELRTPLASIRGYAELTRRSGQELPADAIHSLDRIESESIRMTGLVEDLLLLARLDEGRELERKPVDLTRMLVDVVSDAHAAGPGHVWNLDLPDEPAVITGDAARLHQVFANLLANARIHTDRGTTVTVALASGANQTVVTVTDNGPGIPDALQSTLFERFARGDSSRFRGTGSTGLGLAIARAVVAAHRGEITLESRPGFTRFRVVLPLD